MLSALCNCRSIYHYWLQLFSGREEDRVVLQCSLNQQTGGASLEALRNVAKQLNRTETEVHLYIFLIRSVCFLYLWCTVLHFCGFLILRIWKCKIILIINFDVNLEPGNIFFSFKYEWVAGDVCCSPYLVSRIMSYFDQEFINYSTTVGMKQCMLVSCSFTVVMFCY